MLARPQPLLARGSIIGVVAGVAMVFTALGLIDEAQSAAIVAGIASLIALLGPLLTALLSRGKVTPVDDPRVEVDGTLVRLEPKAPGA